MWWNKSWIPQGLVPGLQGPGDVKNFHSRSRPWSSLLTYWETQTFGKFRLRYSKMLLKIFQIPEISSKCSQIIFKIHFQFFSTRALVKLGSFYDVIRQFEGSSCMQHIFVSQQCNFKVIPGCVVCLKSKGNMKYEWLYSPGKLHILGIW